MPKHTKKSLGQILQHRNRIDDLIKVNVAENIVATTAGDQDTIEKLSKNLSELLGELQRLFILEISQYPLSGMKPSVAENKLVKSAQEARKITKNLNSVISLLEKTTEMVKLITRLIKVFKPG